MKMLLVSVVIIVTAGCAAGRWAQPGKSDLDARRDYFDCENVIVTKHGGWQRVEPFTAGIEIRECMQVKGYHQGGISKFRTIQRKESAMKKELEPLTEPEKEVLRKVLPKAVQRFVHDREDHVTDAKTFFEVWLEMPGMTGQYASLGFSTHPEPLYWTVPPAHAVKIAGYKSKGYDDDYKAFLWRYVEIPTDFLERQEIEQVAWLAQCIENLLKEDEQLRGM